MLRGDVFRGYLPATPRFNNRFKTKCIRPELANNDLYKVQKRMIDSHKRYLIDPFVDAGFEVDIILMLPLCKELCGAFNCAPFLGQRAESFNHETIIKWFNNSKGKIVETMEMHNYTLSLLTPNITPDWPSDGRISQWAHLYATFNFIVEYSQKHGGYEYVIVSRYDNEFRFPFTDGLVSPHGHASRGSTPLLTYGHSDDNLIWFPWALLRCFMKLSLTCQWAECLSSGRFPNCATPLFGSSDWSAGMVCFGPYGMFSGVSRMFEGGADKAIVGLHQHQHQKQWNVNTRVIMARARRNGTFVDYKPRASWEKPIDPETNETVARFCVIGPKKKQ